LKKLQLPFYRGDGNLSVNELQKLCRDFTEYCYQRQLYIQKLESAIENISHHLSSLEHSNKRYTEVGKDKIALVKIMPEITMMREEITSYQEKKQIERKLI
jgi:transcriptional regulator NrdR family protein